MSTGLLLWGISSCSSSKTENTEAAETEKVTADQITSPTADTEDTVDAEKAIVSENDNVCRGGGKLQFTGDQKQRTSPDQGYEPGS